jgi:endonuclease/exonuclease/phosphatase family metal-dependent hydrolase
LIKSFYDDISREELTFPGKMSNYKRSFAHTIADAFGLYHKSEGKGRDRHIVIKREASNLTVGRYSHSEAAWIPGSEFSSNFVLLLFVLMFRTVVVGFVNHRAHSGDFRRCSLCPSNVSETQYPNSYLDPLSIATSEDLSVPYTTDKLVLLTFNVLFDIDDPSRPYHFNDLIYTSLRRPYCFKLLERCNADIVVLQEVTPDFHAELLQQGFVRERYFLSDLTATSLVPGNLIMTKFPMTKVYLHQFKMSPKTMCLAKGLVNGRMISIGAVHLKAGLASLFGFIRARQVREAIQLQALYKFEDGILVGDFNFREGSPQMDEIADKQREEAPMLTENGYTDLWIEKHGESQPFVFFCCSHVHTVSFPSVRPEVSLTIWTGTTSLA